MADYQGLVSAGAPFTGVMASGDVTAVTLDAGKNTFAEYDVIIDSSTVIGTLEESVLNEACFVFSRTVWANLRTQKDDAGAFLLGVGGMNDVDWLLKNDPKSAAGPRPMGSILGFPVYTNRNMPALSASATSTKFGIFGNFGVGMAVGRRGSMSMEQFRSGTFGSKEIALADQTGLVVKDRHAVGIVLPEAFLTIATNAV
jgi:HK97 family phage major capsid protein